MKGTLWSRWEQDYLLRNWSTQTTAQIARRVGRTPLAVIAKANWFREHGVPLPSHSKPAAWSEEEIEILRVFWDLESRERTASRVGRTVLGCEEKAYQCFGSILRRRWDREELEGTHDG